MPATLIESVTRVEPGMVKEYRDNSVQAQVGEVATYGRVVLLAIGRITSQPFAQLTRHFRRCVQKTQSHLRAASLPCKFRSYLYAGVGTWKGE